jgi:hypothetical protein
MIRRNHPSLTLCCLIACLLLSTYARAAIHTDSSTDIGTKKKTPVEEVIPTTIANLQGHKSLYQEGWFVITSSQKALSFAKEHSIDSSAQALGKAKESIRENSTEYAKNIKENLTNSKQTSVDIFNQGVDRSVDIAAGTHKLAKQEIAYSKQAATDAWQSFISGYVYLGERTRDSRTALKNLPAEYVDNISDDFSELTSAINAMRARSTTDIMGQWDNALTNAEAEFKQGYEESGEKNDSITGLWTLLKGYGKGLYQGLFKPAATSSWQTAKYTVKIAGAVVFLPVASTYILTKNTLQSSGMAIYYTGKTGIEVISPTLKGGYLASMSLLSAGAVPVTYVAGTTLGVINQVGSTVAAPVVGIAQGTVTSAGDTLAYGGLVTYDAVVGTTKVFVEQVKSGVVLGYNALTALPAHLLLGGINTAYFLVWDGPKLVIASVQGDVEFNTQTIQPGALPVGAVIDLKALQNNSQIEVKLVSDDPAVINHVLDKLPKDLKKKDLRQKDLKHHD